MRNGPRVGLRVSIALGLTAVIVGLTAVIAVNLFLASTETAQQNAARLFDEIAGRLGERVNNQIADLLDLTTLTAALPVIAEPITGTALDHPATPVLLRALGQNEAYFSAQIGYADGSLLQVIAARNDPRLLTAHHAPPETWTMLRTILVPPGQPRYELWTFLDRAGRVLSDSGRQAPPGFDPRERPWYQQAVGTRSGASLTDPYVLVTLPEPGITASASGPRPGTVVSIHVTLRRLAAFVADQNISPHGGMVLLDRQRRVLALSPVLVPVRGAPPLAPLAGLDHPLLAGLATLPPEARMERVVTAEGEALASLTHWADRNGRMLSLGVVAPFADFTASVGEMQRRILFSAGLTLALLLPLSLLVAGRIARTLTALTQQIGQSEAGDFSGTAPPSPLRDLDQVSTAYNRMNESLLRRARTLDQTQIRLERLIDLALVLAAEPDPPRLMEKLLTGAQELTAAEGGTVYRREGETLRFEIMRNDVLGIRVGGPGEPVPTLAPVPLVLEDGRPNHGNLVSHAVLARCAVAVDAVETETRFDLSATRAFDQRTGYRSRSLLTVPLLTRDGEAIGAIQLINARDNGTVSAFPRDVQRVVAALAAQAATTLCHQQRLEAQDHLIEAMARTLAGAIDQRGDDGHCSRVPDLAIRLTEAAARVDHGPLAGFSLTAEQWREFRIGAWLHDCGKVTTPDFLLDKATRLEAVYNRIHEIRTRFEVLWRDARIARLEAEAAGASPEAAAVLFAATIARLEADFAFVANCNLGETEITLEHAERLRTIAAQSWMRHFDDRLGLSVREVRRLAAVPPPVLPTPEPLLADRPHHVVSRRSNDGSDPDYGAAVIPLYNFGELHCLSVPHGTLTPEEQAKVKEHASQTMALLESLPFPPGLARVPEQAGSHHETLTGSGYPRHLDAAVLSIPARILAIADRFETLTAGSNGNRPRLSEAVRALAADKARGEIDPDLFDLLLTSGVYRDYAERFLALEQIDTVEIESLLGLERSPAR